MQPDASTPTVREHIDAFEQALNTQLPLRHVRRRPTSSQQAEAGAAAKVRSRSTQRSVRPRETDGSEGAVPFTIELISEPSKLPYHAAVLEQVKQYFARLRQQAPGSLHLPLEPYTAPSPRKIPSEYAKETDLQTLLLFDLQPVEIVLQGIVGGDWVVMLDTMANSATPTTVTQADVVVVRMGGGEWEGAVTEEKGLTDEQMQALHASLLDYAIFPCFISSKEEADKEDQVFYWDEASESLRPISDNASLRFGIQINSIITSRIRRSRLAGLDDPYIPLIVTNGARFFVALGRIETIDGTDYGRLGLTPVESLANYPLRVLFFAHALMHRLDPILPPPPGYTLNQALKSTVPPSVLFASRAKTEKTLLLLKPARRDSRSDGPVETGGGASPTRGASEFDAGERGSHSGGTSGGKEGRGDAQFCEKYSSLSAGFDLVAAWWGGGQSLPTTYHLVTTREPPVDAVVPTIVMDRLLAQHESLYIAKCTKLNLVFKQVWVADDLVDELVNERACFEELYEHEDASEYLIGFVGFYESTLGSHLCLVTEAGEALEDWTAESDAVINIVRQFHLHGFIHGDLAERNVVKTPRGLRLIDLGRARRADADDCAREMEQLKRVLAGEAETIDYEWLDCYTFAVCDSPGHSD